MEPKLAIEKVISKAGYPTAIHSIINKFSETDLVTEQNVSVSSGCILRGNLNIERGARLGRGCKLEGDIKIGRRTNIEPDCEVVGTVNIGNFCAIARRNLVQQTNHETQKPALQMRFYEDVLNSKLEHTSSGPINIGNDVWIGAQSIILSGVSVGDGAIIGAGSVVTHDVEPYAVVAGVPAERVGWRFPDEIRQKLMNISWWEWDDEKIRRYKDFFDNKIESIEDIPETS
jgi:virginiamycin A acetyltransferase